MPMSSIKVKFRPTPESGREGTIYYQITHRRTARLLSTDYRIRPEEWNTERSSLKVIGTPERRAQILAIKESINCDVERFQRIIRNLDDRLTAYTSDDIIEEFRRYSQEYSLFGYMQTIITRLKQKSHLGTADNYKSTLNNFRHFRNNDDICLDRINARLIEDYQAWLTGRGLVLNTSSFYIRILRAVYNRAVDEGIIENHYPFRHVYTGVDKTVKRALPLETIRKMNQLDLGSRPKLDFARDMFVLSFYFRGMSFIDMAFLRKSDLRNGAITYRRRKTHQQMIIGWTKEMQDILNKYEVNPTERLLPILTKDNVDLRAAFKKIRFQINQNLKKIGGELKIPIPLTLYVARHSWASGAKAKGFPLEVISEGLGHDSVATTQIYLTSLETTVIDHANAILMKAIR